jgi:hypothetical protein
MKLRDVHKQIKGREAMPTIVYNAPMAVTESGYGLAIGYYTDCDTAICRDCAPAGFASGDYSQWAGFEGWESPSAIFMDSESDSPTQCAKCEAVICHDLTPDGAEYVIEAIGEFITGNGHTPDVMAQWWDAYSDSLDASDMRDIIETAMVAAGCRTLETAEQG